MIQEGDSVTEINSATQHSETKELNFMELLNEVTLYPSGQCRQSEKGKMEPKAISK